MQIYYGVLRTATGRYVGRVYYWNSVYHWNTTGNKEIGLYRTREYDTIPEAVDDAAEWLEDNERDADSDGTW